MSLPPRIGITGVVRHYEGADRTGVNAAYTRAVLAAGGVPLIIPSLVDPAHVGLVADALDGILFTGGEDIEPSRYGAAASPLSQAPDPGRDAMEIALVAAARARALPVLGICRGMQLVNVALGGTLWQDLPTERPGAIHHDPDQPRTRRTHSVRIEPGSLVAAALGRDRLEVNSVHHQAVRDLAPALRAVGWADDGVIEAAEGDRTAPWLVTVQWHPEEIYRDPDTSDRQLFGELVRAAVSRSPANGAREPARETAERALGH